MNYDEYKQLKQDIENEYKRNLEALEMVWRRCKNISTSVSEDTTTTDLNSHYLENVSGAVRIVVEGLSGEFSADDVKRGLKDHGMLEGKEVRRISITNTLHRLFRRGELEVVRKGQGRTPGLYRKKAK